MPLTIKPTGILDSPISTIERFSKRFAIRDDGCWEWKGYINAGGYGQFTVKGTSRAAHRVMWELAGRSVNLVLQLDHLCRNRACVNPDHLEQVSNKENVLRGQGISANNARKTHCLRGHPYSGNNLTYKLRDGSLRRVCKKCRVMDVAKFKKAHKKSALTNSKGGV